MWLSKPPAGTQLNRNHPLTQGLVSCWLFNEGSGLTVNDLSGNNNTGILTSFEPFSSSSGWSGGMNGIELRFDGTNDLVNCGKNTVLNFGTQNLSIDSIVRTAYSGTLGTIEAKRNPGLAANPGYQVFVSSGHIASIICDGSAARIRLDGSIIVNDNIKSHHIAVTYNRQSNMSIFVDSKLDNSTSITAQQGNINNTLSTVIGADSGIGSFLPSEIILVRLWNRVLSPQEIKQLYSQPYSMFWDSSKRIRKY